jgi:hypothetical protein
LSCGAAEHDVGQLGDCGIFGIDFDELGTGIPSEINQPRSGPGCKRYGDNNQPFLVVGALLCDR